MLIKIFNKYSINLKHLMMIINNLDKDYHKILMINLKIIKINLHNNKKIIKKIEKK